MKRLKHYQTRKNSKESKTQSFDHTQGSKDKLPELLNSQRNVQKYLQQQENQLEAILNEYKLISEKQHELEENEITQKTVIKETKDSAAEASPYHIRSKYKPTLNKSPKQIIKIKKQLEPPKGMRSTMRHTHIYTNTRSSFNNESDTSPIKLMKIASIQ